MRDRPQYWKMEPNPSNHKKRILVFVPEFPRLTETFIQREISKLIDLGSLDITVFSIQETSGEVFSNVKKHLVYRHLNLFVLIRAWVYFLLRKPAKILCEYRAFISFDRGFSGGKVPYKNSLLHKSIFFTKSVGYAHLFLQFDPDHIHANFMSWPSTMAMIASKLLGIDYSISAHALDIMVEGEYFEQKVSSAKFVAICNKFAYQYCLDHSGQQDTSNILMMYHGVDSVKVFSNSVQIDKPDRAVLFNGGSRLVEKKGQKYLIESMRLLKDKGYDFELHIAGPGPLYAELVSQIKSLNLEDNVFIHGNGEGVPFDIIVSYLKIADLVVQSNINLDSGDADGVPTFVIESALARKPIVATDAGSITDLIEDGVTGLIVHQRNPVVFAEAVIKLLDDPELASRLGASARERALQMFDLDRNIKELESLLLK